MRSILTVAALLACAASTAPQNREQVFRSGVQSVLVDVSVLQGRAPVANLSAAAFTVADNGAQQQVNRLERAAIPLDVSLVVDTTWFTQGLAPNSGPAGTDELHRNVRELARLLLPQDRLGVITFASDLVETRAMSPVSDASAPISLANDTSFRATHHFRIGQALLMALTAFTPSDRRHLVVLFTAARLRPDVPLFETIVPVAGWSDTLLYSVLSPPLQEPFTHRITPYYPPNAMVRDALTQAAEATGGKAYLTGDIVGAFRDVLKQFRSSYVLRYTLQGVPTRGWHDIVVKVPSCPTCTIRARRGYMGR